MFEDWGAAIEGVAEGVEEEPVFREREVDHFFSWMTIGYDVEEGNEEDWEGEEIDHAAIFGCKQRRRNQLKVVKAEKTPSLTNS